MNIYRHRKEKRALENWESKERKKESLYISYLFWKMIPADFANAERRTLESNWR